MVNLTDLNRAALLLNPSLIRKKRWKTDQKNRKKGLAPLHSAFSV